MKYREAKQLIIGDHVKRKSDQAILHVQCIEIYGQYKKVRINCLLEKTIVSVFNDEVE